MRGPRPPDQAVTRTVDGPRGEIMDNPSPTVTLEHAASLGGSTTGWLPVLPQQRPGHNAPPAQDVPTTAAKEVPNG